MVCLNDFLLLFAGRTIPRRVVTTTTTTTTPQPRREFLQRRRPQPFERTQRLDFRSEVPVREYKPIHHDYDYYDDGNLGIVDNHSHHSKVIQMFYVSIRFAKFSL